MGRFRLSLLLMLALTAVPSPSRAQSWATNGVALSPTSIYRNYTTAVADGSGGVYVAWSDLQVGDYDVYVQHYDGNGDRVAGWPEHGLVVCNAAQAQFPPSLLADGSGGVYVAWEDYRANGIDAALYFTRVLANGTYATGWQQNGTPVEPGTTRHTSEIAMALDGSGGLMVAYTADSPDEFYRGVRYNHFTSSHGVSQGWPTAGYWLTSYYTSDQPGIVADGLGRYVVAYNAYEPTANKVWAKRVTFEGVLDPNWHFAPSAKGVAVNPGTSSDMGSCRMVNISPGLVAFVWLDEWRGGGDSDVQVSVLDSLGVPPAVGNWWHTQDVASSVGDCGPPQAIADGSGGLMIAWRDLRLVGTGGQPKLYGKHFDSDGTSTWSPSGNALVNWYVTGDPRLLRMSDGTYRAVFQSSNGGGAEIYAAQFTQAAATSSGWSSVTGNAICVMDGLQWGATLVPSSGTDAIVVWNDERAASSGVYGAKIQATGAVPAQSSLRAIEAGENGVTVEWLIEGEHAVHVERSVDGVAWDALGEAVESSPGTFAFVDANVRAGARYAYRPVFASGGHGEAAWIEVPTLAFALRVAQGNPARGAVAFSCALPTAAPARLRVHDVSGRLVKAFEFAGSRSVTWDAAGRAPGVYVVTLEHAGLVKRAKFTLLD